MAADLKVVLQRAEVKRIYERITKKELCTILDVNYSYYVNTVGGRNLQGKNLEKTLRDYLAMTSNEVYNMVFKSREGDSSSVVFNNPDEGEFISVVKSAEKKRIGEKISKVELTSILDVNYTYYANTLSGINKSGKDLMESLSEYLDMSREEVYFKVYSKKKKEKYHRYLEITDDLEGKILSDLKSQGVVHGPIL
ncbi:hypothetical protein P8891_05835 [Bacillus atrophaeus]|uniref:hypothetical protein n=1 Tax=Bacillus atrophaeus TaxID=1452 RepID=UPI002283190F|nr:hypothetical protein [Bacillus atrophaeus]MCY7947034.1 hypothetical protein [Bacillus atrophaeus]MCY8098503.1 hypothetical protein [Bacillus atrophaeus]MCY9170054.1 hypothetical protein [Bacillus atrophaeus]MEC0740608.1 hypothetical protein [Bacillus atrophaeus]MEC0746956.1 hypothetical protein [Bacillus atrophaeus]